MRRPKKCWITLAATVLSLSVPLLGTSAQELRGSALPPAPQYQQPAPYYAADAADYEARLNALEAEVKKKQDKPDSKKGFTRVITGRAYFDSYHLSGDPSATLNGLRQSQDWNGVKDLRIGVKGEGYGIFDYSADLFLATRQRADGATNVNGGVVEIRDLWFGVKNVPLLEYFKIGHYRVEDGIANLTGNTNITFLEFDGRDFATGRRLGISTQHLWGRERIRFFAGVFEHKNVAQTNLNEAQIGHDIDWGTITNLRLTYLPYISKGKDGKYNGKKFLLLGGNYSYFDIDKVDSVHANGPFQQRFATTAFTPIQNLADSIGISSSYQQVGLEFAYQNGPLAVQSETYARSFRNVSHSNPTIWGTYAEVRYFLTGDFRKFNTASAAWGAVDLKHNLDLQKINDHNLAKWLGGWEVAAKWSHTDTHDVLAVPDAAVFTGYVNDITLGLNWYWNPQTRVMFDYIHVLPTHNTATGKDHSDIDIFATSFRYHF